MIVFYTLILIEINIIKKHKEKKTLNVPYYNNSLVEMIQLIIIDFGGKKYSIQWKVCRKKHLIYDPLKSNQ